jgi:hypothetical protein
MNTADIRTASVRRLTMVVVALGLAVALGALATPAQASLIFSTSGGSTAGGQPVSASATFTVTNGNILIVLDNLQADPTSVIQCISSLRFSIIDTNPTGISVGSESCTDAFVAGNGTYTTDPGHDPGWSLSTSGGTTAILNGLAGGPSYTVLGPPDGSDLYGSANSSIAGNGPHNPFAFESATFNLSLAGVTEDSIISNVVFGFGTTAGTDVPTIPPVSPEPATMALMALGAAGLLLRRKRK